MSWLKYINGLILDSEWPSAALWVNRKVILQGCLKVKGRKGVWLGLFFVCFVFVPGDIKIQAVTYWSSFSE